MENAKCDTDVNDCIIFAFWREIVILLHANNKGADQHAHLHSVISNFIIHFLERMIAKLSFMYEKFQYSS